MVAIWLWRIESRGMWLSIKNVGHSCSHSTCLWHCVTSLALSALFVNGTNVIAVKRTWNKYIWMYLVYYTQYASKFGKLSSGHRTGKGQFSFQSQRKLMQKNVQTTVQLQSSHMLAMWGSKFSKPGFNSTWTRNFQMFKLDSEKAEEPEIKLPTSTGSLKKQESSRKASISALLTMPKPLTVWITTNCGKFLKRWEYQTTWRTSLEIYMQVKKH